MKIRIQHENKSIYLEVPDEDFTLMIETDYEDRLSSAEDKETVTRRSPQEIMDERFNKPEYNNWHKFDRHRGMPKKPFRKDDQEVDETDHMDYFLTTQMKWLERKKKSMSISVKLFARLSRKNKRSY